MLADDLPAITPDKCERRTTDCQRVKLPPCGIQCFPGHAPDQKLQRLPEVSREVETAGGFIARACEVATNFSWACGSTSLFFEQIGAGSRGWLIFHFAGISRSALEQLLFDSSVFCTVNGFRESRMLLRRRGRETPFCCHQGWRNTRPATNVRADLINQQ